MLFNARVTKIPIYLFTAGRMKNDEYFNILFKMEEAYIY